MKKILAIAAAAALTAGVSAFAANPFLSLIHISEPTRR